MTIEVNKAVARRLYEEAISQQRPEILEQIVAADATDETAATTGRQGFYQHLQRISETVENVRATVTDLVAEGDRVVVFWQMEGVQRGPLFGVPPSGRPFTGRSISCITFRDGQIIRYCVLADRLGIIKQLDGQRLPVLPSRAADQVTATGCCRRRPVAGGRR
jgi:predicted ester cyclase